jgi:DNA-binding LytR/AlgR family response regulator
MPEMDGIEVAERLNLKGIDYKIVMLTGKSERFKEAFKIGAFRFVTKPIATEELFEAIDDVRKCMIGGETANVICGGNPYEIHQKDIIYIEGNKSVTNIYTKNKAYHSHLSLGGWTEQLEEKMFFQCHKSYIVNLAVIEEIDEDIATLVTEERVPIARRRKKALLQAFMEYDTRYR